MIYEIRFDAKRMKSILTLGELRSPVFEMVTTFIALCLWDPETGNFLDRIDAEKFVNSMTMTEIETAVKTIGEQQKIFDIFGSMDFGGNKRDDL